MKTKTFIPFDAIANGKLSITHYGYLAGANRESAIVEGISAARAWLDANGGYASLKANFSGAQLTGWSIMRVVKGYGHRCCGHISPAE